MQRIMSIFSEQDQVTVSEFMTFHGTHVLDKLRAMCLYMTEEQRIEAIVMMSKLGAQISGYTSRVVCKRGTVIINKIAYQSLTHMWEHARDGRTLFRFVELRERYPSLMSELPIKVIHELCFGVYGMEYAARSLFDYCVVYHQEMNVGELNSWLQELIIELCGANNDDHKSLLILSISHCHLLDSMNHHQQEGKTP